jgi:hypothetical protein
VHVVGEVEIQNVARKTAEGSIADAVNPVERGYKVGPLRRKFRQIDPVPAERSETGLIVATLGDTGPMGDVDPRNRSKKKKKKKKEKRRNAGYNPVTGEEQFVIIDMGANEGVVVGNVLEVVRKGDEYTPKRAFTIPYEDGWPRRVTATVLVVQVQPDTSLAVVTYSSREVERGDHVELRGPGFDTDTDSGSRVRADAHAEGRTDRGKVEGSAGLRIGK